MNYLTEVLFVIIAAFSFAKLEIQIEGKDGWAKNLPTWRKKNKITKTFIGDSPLTGYHLWAIITLLIFMHSLFFLGLTWSIQVEIKIMSLFIIVFMLEDFLWFILNPDYGIKKFNSKFVPWHKWVGPIPFPYIMGVLLLSLLFLINQLLIKLL